VFYLLENTEQHYRMPHPPKHCKPNKRHMSRIQHVGRARKPERHSRSLASTFTIRYLNAGSQAQERFRSGTLPPAKEREVGIEDMNFANPCFRPRRTHSQMMPAFPKTKT
jgi:hypothetical protein